LKPRFIMTSASSRTAYLKALKSKFLRSIWSLMRPVVPTKISTPRLSSLVYAQMSTPPYTQSTLYSLG
jgi:hypothetical protein